MILDLAFAVEHESWGNPLDLCRRAVQTALDMADADLPDGGAEQFAKTINEAKKYFGEEVDFYVDGGELAGEPSTLIEIRDGKATVLRKGAYFQKARKNV